MNDLDFEGEDTLVSPRKLTDMTSVHSEPKRKPAKKKRTPRAMQKPQPFMEQDEFSDITIMVDDKRLYSSRALLAYHSPVFMKRLSSESSGTTGSKGGGKGKGAAVPKELDLSEYKFHDVYDLVAFMDPRVDTALSDKEAMNLLPLAEEFDVKQLRKTCEHTITSSYFKMRRGRRAGSVPTDVTIKHLAIADRYKFDDLMHMCMEECVANDNPFSNKSLSDSKELSEAVKVKVLEQKLDKLNMVLAKERRTVSEFKQARDGIVRNSDGGKIWKR